MSYPTTHDVLSHLNGYPRDLRWSDFRRVNNSLDPPWDAQTATSFSGSYRSAALRSGVYRLSRVSVTVRLVRQPTWVVRSFLTNASTAAKAKLLRHEQGHHDIIGLIARDLCRRWLSLEMSENIVEALTAAGNSRRSRLNYVRTEMRRDAQAASARATTMRNWLENTNSGEGLYERETNHGNNATAQDKWNHIFAHARSTDTSLSVTLIVWGYTVPGDALL